MNNTDFRCILENYYRNIETMQPASQRFKAEYDRRNSTPEWSGMTDPSKGPQMLTPSVDEENVGGRDKMSKIKALIEIEIQRAPKKMTYAIRVLKKLLNQMESL